MNDAPVFDLFRQASIKTVNQLMDFSDSSWQDFPDTCRSTGVYIIFYKVFPIEHFTHVPGSVAQSIAEIEYNAALIFEQGSMYSSRGISSDFLG